MAAVYWRAAGSFVLCEVRSNSESHVTLLIDVQIQSACAVRFFISHHHHLPAITAHQPIENGHESKREAEEGDNENANK